MKQKLTVPLQPGIATEIFRKCLTLPFEEEFGVEVETPPRSERYLEEVTADAEAGKCGFDVVEWGPFFFPKAKRAGLCEPLDFSLLPNTRDMHERYLDKDGFGVGVFVWGMAPVYVPGLAPFTISSWGDFWKPEIASRLALRDQIAMGHLVPIACRALGIDTRDLGDDKVFDRCWNKLTELAGQVPAWAESEGHVQALIAEKKVAVSHNFIDVVQIQKDRGVSIEVVFPEEGVIWGFRSWTIVKGCRNPELAHAFINFAQGREAQKRLAETFYGHPTNGTVELDEAIVPRIYGGRLNDDDLQFPDWDWYVERPDIDARWAAVVEQNSTRQKAGDGAATA